MHKLSLLTGLILLAFFSYAQPMYWQWQNPVTTQNADLIKIDKLDVIGGIDQHVLNHSYMFQETKWRAEIDFKFLKSVEGMVGQRTAYFELFETWEVGVKKFALLGPFFKNEPLLYDLENVILYESAGLSIMEQAEIIQRMKDELSQRYYKRCSGW